MKHTNANFVTVCVGMYFDETVVKIRRLTGYLSAILR